MANKRRTRSKPLNEGTSKGNTRSPRSGRVAPPPPRPKPKPKPQKPKKR